MPGPLEPVNQGPYFFIGIRSIGDSGIGGGLAVKREEDCPSARKIIQTYEESSFRNRVICVVLGRIKSGIYVAVETNPVLALQFLEDQVGNTIYTILCNLAVWILLLGTKVPSQT